MSEYLKHVLEIEKVKKECDRLMAEKIDKYESIIYQLKKDLAMEKEEHQYDNMVHEKELEQMRKK